MTLALSIPSATADKCQDRVLGLHLVVPLPSYEKHSEISFCTSPLVPAALLLPHPAPRESNSPTPESGRQQGKESLVQVNLL